MDVIAQCLLKFTCICPKAAMPLLLEIGVLMGRASPLWAGLAYVNRARLIIGLGLD